MEKLKILALTKYSRKGPSSRLRTYQYLKFLADKDIEVTISPLLEDSYLETLFSNNRKSCVEVIKAFIRRVKVLKDQDKYDLIWIEKELFPWLPVWGEKLLYPLKVPYIVDYDDAVFHNYDLNKNPCLRLMLGQKIDKVIKGAVLVIAGNSYLVERARKAGAKQVEYIPTVIDLEHYPLNAPPQNKEFNIGWIGSPNTARYLNIIEPALQEICKEGDTKITLVGSGTVNMPGIPLEIRRWSEDTEAELIRGFDAGIMPLPDEPWERGKCGYKLIQYMASSRPVVASPVGVNRQIVKSGINGFLAETTREWVEALNKLRKSPELKLNMGKEGRTIVENNYCLQKTAPQVAAIISKAIKESR